MRQYRLLPFITGLFTATLLVSNILDNKIFALFGLTLPAGIIVFPLAYLVGDILTEVYGYSVSRTVIWTGLFSLALMVAAIEIARRLPVASIWPHQTEFDIVLGRVPRIVLASVLAYFSGEFVNSYVVAKIKVVMSGRHMWFRFVASTFAGQFVDTSVFVAIAFIGVLPSSALPALTASAWLVKVAWEIVALPVTLPIVRRIKSFEREDYFDTDTQFNPFLLSARTKRTLK